MSIHKDCIHWPVCNRPCPIDVNDCGYYIQIKFEYMGSWIRAKDNYSSATCSICGYTANDPWYYCPVCGSFNTDDLCEEME